jgi:thioredoxin reductase
LPPRSWRLWCPVGPQWLGLATVDTPDGIALKVNERRETSMPGIYAAGDLATPLMPSVTLASSQGAMAGIFAQQSMLV